MTAHDYVTDEAELLHEIRDLLREILTVLKTLTVIDDGAT